MPTLSMIDPLTLAGMCAKFAWVVSGLVAIGLASHAALAIAPLQISLRRAVVIAAAWFAGAAGARLVAGAAELAGDWRGAGDMLAIVWSVQQGAISLSLLGALALVMGALAKMRPMLAVGGACAGAAFGLTGHAQTQDAPWLACFLVQVHVLIAGFWTAAPITLWPHGGLSTGELARRHQEFGRIALILIPILFAAGTILAVWFGGGVSGLSSSAYGAAITTKAAFAAGALGLGAWNRLHVARLLETHAPAARSHLRVTLLLDILLFAGIAIATTVATTVFAPGEF